MREDCHGSHLTSSPTGWAWRDGARDWVWSNKALHVWPKTSRELKWTSSLTAGAAALVETGVLTLPGLRT